MTILVTGGTGNMGGRVVAALCAEGADVRVLVRDGSTTKLRSGVQGVVGDLTTPDTIRAAVEGVDTVFLLAAVTPDELTQSLTAVGIVRDAGIKGLVYFSVLNGDVYADVPHFAGKHTVERMIAAEGLPATVLRPSTFMQNDAGMRAPILAGVYPQPIGHAGVAMVDADDIAAVAARAILAREAAASPLPSDTIAIVGPEDLTGTSVAAIWQDVIGREVAYAGDDLDGFEQRAKEVLPPWMAYDMRAMNRGFQTHGMRGTPEIRGRLETLLGRPLRTYRAFAEATARTWAEA